MAGREAPIPVSRDIERDYPGADRRATASVINLLRTESLVSQRLSAALRPYDLTPATFNVLMILRGAGEALCPWQIGERLLVTRGTVTGVLDSLQKRGLISRVPHPADRRMLNIEITPAAEELLDELLPGFFAGEAAMMGGLSAREKETLVRLLGKIQATIEA